MYYYNTSTAIDLPEGIWPKLLMENSALAISLSIGPSTHEHNQVNTPKCLLLPTHQVYKTMRLVNSILLSWCFATQTSLHNVQIAPTYMWRHDLASNLGFCSGFCLKTLETNPGFKQTTTKAVWHALTKIILFADTLAWLTSGKAYI